MTIDALVIDIGGDTGALIVHAPEELVGAEIEVARADKPLGHPVHNVVRARLLPGEVVFAAVFPDLPAGRYARYRSEGEPFTVAAGRVTEIDWW